MAAQDIFFTPISLHVALLVVLGICILGMLLITLGSLIRRPPPAPPTQTAAQPDPDKQP